MPTAQLTRSKKKNQKSTAASSKKEESKHISIRIPEGMIRDLRKTAKKKGDVGYQKLIKSYISQGLEEESGSKSIANLPSFSAPSRTPVKKKTQKVQMAKVQLLDEHDIIAEDIVELAKSLKPYYRYFSGKTFLITGAFGFLGKYISHLLKYLNDHCLKTKVNAYLLDNFVTGYEQQVVLDKNLKFVRHDVIQPYVPETKVDYILHMAGIASPVYYTKYPIETMDVGTIGTRNMLELAAKIGVKSFLFTSSSEVYGDPDPAHVPTNEDYYGNVSMTGPRSCYDESKRFGETMCVAFWNVFKVPAKVVRPFNVYGPGIRPDDYRVLPNFIEHALRKEPLPIHGAGHNTRSFCYIVDAVEALFRVLFSKANGESFNIGNPGPELSVRDLAKLVADAMPHKVDIVNIDPPHAVYASSDPKRRCPDISKLQKITGFKPKYDITRGLKRTIQWFSQR